MEADNHEAAEYDIVEEIDTEHEIRIANHFNTTAISSGLGSLFIYIRRLSDRLIFTIEWIYWQYIILRLIWSAVEDTYTSFWSFIKMIP